MTTYDLVDIGTKHASSIDYIRSIRPFPPHRCLGVDLNSEYAPIVRGKGYAFLATDICSPDLEFPSSLCYSLFHILEHLPSVALSNIVLRKALLASQGEVLFRMPVMQDPDPLLHAGLRFAWTNWNGHPTPYAESDMLGVVASVKGFQVVSRKSLRPITSSFDDRIVPLNAPVDTVKYEPTLDPKPAIRFDEPLEAEVDFVIRRTG